MPLQDKEVKTILKQMGIETPKLKIDFKKGDRVKVTSGPFFDFTGVVDEIAAGEGDACARSSRSSAAKRRSNSSSFKSRKVVNRGKEELLDGEVTLADGKA